MVNGQKIGVVLPAYNAEKTLKVTYNAIPMHIVDEVILVDDCSTDQTLHLAVELGIKHILKHDVNKGYGGNQKTCYAYALSLNCDIIIMLHPDYQYEPRLLPSMIYMISSGIYPVVIGSRILGNGALKGGMPIPKYISNRFLTLLQNILTGQKLSEYHTGYRAFSANVLKDLNLEVNSNDFIFDNEILSQIIFKKYEIGEISVPTKYFPEASSINYKRSVIYALGVIKVSFQHFFSRLGLKHKRYR